jgi:hypothetical protein
MIWIDAVMTYLVISVDLPGGTTESNEKPQSWQLAFGIRF